ncbi:MAG: DASS family sodium-coupled anion symporter, partial [Moraxellaceae bacterium]|nr:DASS family sodium-coupled anion symporter [Moraxellaceae bacterium]
MKPWAIALAILTSLLAASGPDAPAAQAGMAIFALAGVLWLTEAIPITFTALLIPLLAVVLGLADMKSALINFAHPTIFLFLGGFALAAAMTKQGIDRWLASQVMALAHGHALRAAFLLIIATSLLSMWISNTATAVMMLPVAIGLLAPMQERFPRYGILVLLGLAWGANIGGIATLVGSPPNAITAAALGWGFSDWMRVGVPAYLVLMPVGMGLLWLLLRPEANLPAVSTAVMPFPSGREAKLTIAIFLLTVMLWVFGASASKMIGIKGDFDTWVALLAIALLGFSRVISWGDIERQSNWGVLLLFGGGITLSVLIQSSGAGNWIANIVLAWVPSNYPWLLYLVIALFVIFLSELVSNTACAALLVPLVMTMASVTGLNPVTMAVL